MPIVEVTADRINTVQPTSFEAERFRERGDLQRLLRDHIEVVATEVMVVAEEFGYWSDSKRRIDLLGLDKDANLVVFELKRTNDGGHMELQAIRYAAMVSTMTFDQVVAAHETYIAKRGNPGDAREAILEFLGWVDPNPLEFAQSVRIVLVAEGFSKELTTAVMWLNLHDLDIQCIRLTPYLINERLFIDVQHTIPLPEAAEFQVNVRNKTQQERGARVTQRDYTKFDVTAEGVDYRSLAKRHALFRVVTALCHHGVTPEQVAEYLPSRMRHWLVIDGEVVPTEVAALAAEQARAQDKSFDETRWFLEPTELIHLNGRTYAFSNQWGAGVAAIMTKLLADFPTEGLAFQESNRSDPVGAT